MIRVVERIAAEWEVLARALGFDEPRIKIIIKENCNQLEEACFAMFTRWLNGEHDLKPLTWHDLIQCLEKTNKFEGLAYDLKKVIMLQTGILITGAHIIILHVYSYSHTGGIYIVSHKLIGPLHSCR